MFGASKLENGLIVKLSASIATEPVTDFAIVMQRVTRFGESGVWGFINHLDSREVGQLLAQSIATEARQQQIFRQMSGLSPMNVWVSDHLILDS